MKRELRFRREKNVWILDLLVVAESVFGVIQPAGVSERNNIHKTRR